MKYSSSRKIFLLISFLIIAAAILGIAKAQFENDIASAVGPLQSIWIMIKGIFTAIVSGILGIAFFVCDNGTGVFRYLIGAECTKDLVFLIALTIWITILVFIYEILGSYGSFSKGTSFVIAFALSVLMANFGVIIFLSDLVVTMIKNSPIIIAVFILVIIILYGTLKILSAGKKKREKEQEEKMSRLAGKALTEAMTKSVDRK